jgi:hypothetical protein
MLTQTSLADPRLGEILAAEPRLQPILDQALHQETGPRYDRILAYIHLRNQITHLVGWHAAHLDLRNSGDYQLVLETIINLLPPDHLDLRYPPPPPYRHP